MSDKSTSDKSVSDKSAANKGLMQAAIADMVGSALFMWVVLAATSNLVVAAGLFAVLSLVGSQVGCTVNPMISTGLLLNGDISRKTWVYHVFFQMLGAVIGVVLYSWVNGRKLQFYQSDCNKVDKADKSDASKTA